MNLQTGNRTNIAGKYFCGQVTGPIVAEIQRFRYQIWKAEGAALYDETSGMIADWHDEHALHWGVFDEDRLIAAARLCIHDQQSDVPDNKLFSTIDLPSPIASMNRLVVLREYRGMGISSALDGTRIESARRSGARVIVVAAVTQSSRIDQLEKEGFTFLGGDPAPTQWSPTVQIRACYRLLDA